jgi:hypothetical protein
MSQARRPSPTRSFAIRCAIAATSSSPIGSTATTSEIARIAAEAIPRVYYRATIITLDGSDTDAYGEPCEPGHGYAKTLRLVEPPTGTAPLRLGVRSPTLLLQATMDLPGLGQIDPSPPTSPAG